MALMGNNRDKKSHGVDDARNGDDNVSKQWLTTVKMASATWHYS
jgi:hypothetical protein